MKTVPSEPRVFVSFKGIRNNRVYTGGIAFKMADRCGGSPILRRGTKGCVQISIGTNSASLGRSTPGCWRWESSHYSNLRFKRSNVVFTFDFWMPWWSVLAELTNYQSIYILTLTYGHELWVVTKMRSQKQVDEMSFLSLLLNHMDRCRLRWFEHLFRLTPICLPERKPKLPRRHWRDYTSISRLAWERLGVSSEELVPWVLLVQIYLLV